MSYYTLQYFFAYFLHICHIYWHIVAYYFTYSAYSAYYNMQNMPYAEYAEYTRCSIFLHIFLAYCCIYMQTNMQNITILKNMQP
jgi:hypothetical protein